MLNLEPVLRRVGTIDLIVFMMPLWKTLFSTGYVLVKTTALNGIVT